MIAFLAAIVRDASRPLLAALGATLGVTAVYFFSQF